MSIKLKIASFWLPDFILKRELDNVAKKTMEGLNNVLKLHAPGKMVEINDKDEVLRGNMKERREIMAKAHNNRVMALIKELGYNNAIKIARKSMSDVGFQLGQEARHKLGIGNSFKDLESAAKILYKILGIEFKIEYKSGKLIMIVNRCALSKYYSPEACVVLSAADEGVVRGLNENMNMEFKERITEGASECIACFTEEKL